MAGSESHVLIFLLKNVAHISLINHRTFSPRASPGRINKVRGLFYSLWHKKIKLIKAKN